LALYNQAHQDGLNPPFPWRDRGKFTTPDMGPWRETAKYTDGIARSSGFLLFTQKNWRQHMRADWIVIYFPLSIRRGNFRRAACCARPLPIQRHISFYILHCRPPLTRKQNRALFFLLFPYATQREYNFPPRQKTSGYLFHFCVILI
jgi:hypothetical protein